MPFGYESAGAFDDPQNVLVGLAAAADIAADIAVTQRR